MTYEVEQFEDSLVSALKADLRSPGVNIRPHAGDVGRVASPDPKDMEGLIRLLPFIFVQYMGFTPPDRSSGASVYVHQLLFRFFCGAKSLRTKQEAQRNVYALLRMVFDNVHGRKLPGTGQGLPELLVESGYSATYPTGFNCLGPFIETGGPHEQLVVNLPTIVIYQQDYSIQVVAKGDPQR